MAQATSRTSRGAGEQGPRHTTKPPVYSLKAGAEEPLLLAQGADSRAVAGAGLSDSDRQRAGDGPGASRTPTPASPALPGSLCVSPDQQGRICSMPKGPTLAHAAVCHGTQLRATWCWVAGKEGTAISSIWKSPVFVFLSPLWSWGTHAACGWIRVKHGVQIPEQAGPVPAPAASAPRPALCQTSSWETLNGSFQAFVFLAAVFLFSLPLSLLPLLGSSVYPPRLCRAPPRRPPARRCQRDEKAEPRCSRCLPGLLGSVEMLNSKC